MRNLFIGFFILLSSNFVLAMSPAEVDMVKATQEMSSRANHALDRYTPELAVETGQIFSRMYYDIFEGAGMEFALSIYDNDAMLSLEMQFSKLMSLAMNGVEKQHLKKEWKILETQLWDATNKHQDKHEDGYWALFLQSFFILLREGFEAILVVTALITYLRRSGSGEKVNAIWIGVGLALILSLITAWLLSYVIESSGAMREALEGTTMLVAALLLLYVSYWLYAKREAQRWQAFINSQMDKATKSDNIILLAGTAFLAVYREGAETILFYQALLSGSSSDVGAIGAGFVVALIALIVVFVVMRTLSVRLPLKLFFSATAIFLFIMSFIFIGQGILELQVAGWISVTDATMVPKIPTLGIFPTLESSGAQLLLLISTLAIYLYTKIKNLKLE